MTALSDAQFYLRSMRAELLIAKAPQTICDLAALLETKLAEAAKELHEQSRAHDRLVQDFEFSKAMKGARRRA